MKLREVPVQLQPKDRSDTVVAATETVETLFANARRAFPRPTVLHTLYFQTGKTDLTVESEALFQQMLQKVSTLAALEIEITGHTDTKGPASLNDALSLERAKHIETRVYASSPPKQTLIRVIGRGEREPLTPTPDETDEPINRRVEIRLR